MSAPPSMHKGVVKSVLSGDTIVIRGQPRGGPPPEKVLSFAGVSAPRLGRRPQGPDGVAEPDEPFAWQAREFLREKLIGKHVQFTISYTVPSQREYGTVFLGVGQAAENITQSLVQSGYVTLKEGGRDDDAASQTLVALEQHAKSLGVGVHAPENLRKASVRKVQHTLANPAKFVEKHAYKPVKCIVEHIRDASTFRAIVKSNWQSVTCSLTGIKAPGFRRDNGVDVAEPYATEAKYFVESRLLQREVDIVFEGTSGPQGVLGTVQHPKGNISEVLLHEGFARIMDYSFADVRVGRDKMRLAEETAKSKKLRIWKNYTAPTLDLPAGERDFSAVVVEIINPERIVAKKADGSRVELTLSSLRQPRRPRERKGKDDGGAATADGADGAGANGRKPRRKPLYEVPFMFQAREFLRQKLIGKSANIHIDYVRPAEEPFPEKLCATVTVGSINVAEALIAKGFATVFRHDEFRASSYDHLMQLERQAQKNKVGLHNENAKSMHVADVTSKDSAQRYLTSMQRSGTVAAIVEFVSSGSRLRVYVPKETCQATFLLAGISCPRTAYGDKAGEEFAQEAAQLTKDLCFQRDVELDVIDTDRNGNFVGQIFVDGKNVAELLLQRGYGTVHFTASRYGNESVLRRAEDSAKASKLGVWSNYDAEAEAAAAAAANGDGDATGAAAGTSAKEEVIVTEVESATVFYAQRTSAKDDLDKLSADLNAALSTSATPVESVKRRLLCAAKFSADDAWYRARVVNVDKDTGKVSVRYIDYGNQEDVDPARLANLPEALNELPAQAQRMALTLLAPPPTDYAEEAADVLRKGILNMTYDCTVDYSDKAEDGELCEFVKLVHPESEDNVAKTMLSMGYATVGRTRERRLHALQKELQVCEEEAKTNHEGMWMYGDVSEDPREI